MPENIEFEETETQPEPSTTRRVTTMLVTLGVTVVVGMAASGVTDKINDKIRQIAKTNR